MTAERMRRHRQRKASGEMVLTFPAPEIETVDALVEAKWLDPWEQEDREKILAAAEKAWRHLVTRHCGDSEDAV